MIKPYAVTLTTTAKVVVFVDAEDSDEAIEMAYDYLDATQATFEDEWEVEDVEEDTE